jgi:CHAT domain
MNAFYTKIAQGKTTKAEALRQAQIALITGNYATIGQQRGINDNLSPQVRHHLSHPFYWAPFILIGNGLWQKRAQEKYRLPIYPVLINILLPPSTLTVVNSYQDEFLGFRAIQDYRVINLWEVDAEIVFNQPLPPLLPFVPILRGGKEVSVVQTALQELRISE